ncbi:flagellar export chaperone FliS [Massilia agilis]|uniref:Flagellar secretion chaperone FliS n=1 Tax=Massilia agilis TaxID=1811226 RepID=A0ABT2D953_9BURK|nr:flagellar export chaperone FliS [Massilia agilis]MCS0807379.1 flagellar export chaperone FliS [Massilia agilis]
MFGSMKKGASAYASVGIETGVMSASPHKLIVMLFEGAQTTLRMAVQLMQAGDVPGKGRAISKGIDIIQNGLRASLDKNAGGEIAANLDALYAYMIERLLQANLHNDPERITEVLRLLGELHDAWKAIAPVAANEPAVASAAAPGNDALAPRNTSFVSA